MRKFLLLTVLAVAFGAYADTLTPDEALTRALGQTPAKQIGLNKTNSWKLVETRSVDAQPAVYVFNRQQAPGYVVVAADDATTPLLGFSDADNFPTDPADIPDGFNYWLAEMAREVAANAANPATAQLQAPTLKVSRSNIDPLVKTVWNQTAPYNNSCPTINGVRTYTGCVATAMAQLMKYHQYFKYPDSNTSDTYSYTWAYTNQTLSYDFRNARFDWGNMLNTYATGSTSTQQAAVANLMFACGVATDMNYKPSSSSSNRRNLAVGMVQRMGYSKGMVIYNRDYYSLEEWEDIVYDNLRNYGPVYYEGSDNNGSHAFICDGYQNGYWHINWGWGGKYDQYTLLTVLRPENSNGFTSYQAILSYIRPDRDDIKPLTYMEWKDNWNISTSSVPAGNNFILGGGGYYNASAMTLSEYQPGAILRSQTDGSTTFISDPVYANKELLVLYNITDPKLSLEVPRDLPLGVYDVYPAFKDAEGVVKPFKLKPAFQKTATLTVMPREYPQNLYLIGSLKAGQWNPSVGVPLQKDGAIYTAKGVQMIEGDAYFSFTTALGTTGDGAEWNDIINLSDRYGASTSDEPVVFGTSIPVIKEAAGPAAAATKSWHVTGNGKYDVVVNLEDRTMTVTKPPITDPNIVEGQTFNVYYDNSDTKWQTPTIYYWGAGPLEWPGVEMKPYDGDIWVAVLPNGTSGLLFNAGDGDASKTADFTAIADHVYNNLGDKGPLNPEVEVPDHLYVVGNVNYTDWDTSDPLEMTRRDNTMLATVRLTDSGSGYSFFSLTTTKGTDWDQHINVSDRYGAQTDGQEIIPGTEVTMRKFSPTGTGDSHSSATKAWKITPGTYNLAADFNKNTMLVTKNVATDIEWPKADGEPTGATFFNLLGIPVDNPTHGTYIMLTNGRATKIHIP